MQVILGVVLYVHDHNTTARGLQIHVFYIPVIVEVVPKFVGTFLSKTKPVEKRDRPRKSGYIRREVKNTK